MLYTRKGDDGKTKVFGCDQRISKSSAVAEALGTMDELNSFLGLCKVEAKRFDLEEERKDGKRSNLIVLEKLVHNIQQNLFIVQAELAGADKAILEDKVKEAEKIIDLAEKELPPIKSFFISGGTELAARLDFARTLARRAERRAVAVHENSDLKLSEHTRQYLNRLSSILYTLARLSNHFSGIKEESPDYQ